MKTKYYFSDDVFMHEPVLYNKKILCAFHTSGIERKYGYFYIIDENNQLVLYYTLTTGEEIIQFIKDYDNSIGIPKGTSFRDIFEIPDFKEKYTNNFLQKRKLDNQEYIRNTINKMEKDNIYDAKNEIQGLDGFSIELKLNKEDKSFYSWCYSDDKKYFYILDFVNSILDELNINERYRFKKVEN